MLGVHTSPILLTLPRPGGKLKAVKRPKSLVIGTRGSPLAMIQAEGVRDQIKKRYPDIKLSIRKVKTEGDVRQDQPLYGTGRKGFYTAAIEQELGEGRIDLAVHSMKDVPAVLTPGFQIAAVTERVDPRDVFISPKYSELLSLPRGSKVGTASLRRMTQLKNFRPDLEIVTLRGNVDTRLRKLKEGKMDAIILAAAGLIRLGREKEITEYLAPTLMLPAAGQGALAIEIRADDDVTRHHVSFLNDAMSAIEIRAERAFIRKLSGGCQVPITAHAEVDGVLMEANGLVASPDGKEIMREQIEGNIKEPEKLGELLADRLLDQGAQRLLDQIQSYEQKR